MRGVIVSSACFLTKTINFGTWFFALTDRKITVRYRTLSYCGVAQCWRSVWRRAMPALLRTACRGAGNELGWTRPSGAPSRCLSQLALKCHQGAAKGHFQHGREFIIDDDRAVILDILQRSDRLDLQRASRRFLSSFDEVGELAALLVEDGHLTASHVKVITRH
jgi:hypothetical protein